MSGPPVARPKAGDLALTLWQPRASLVMAGVNDVVNRTWPVPRTVGGWGFACRCGKYPFRMWVHAGKRWDHRTWPEYLYAYRDADADKINALTDAGAQVDECDDGYWRVWRPSLPAGALLGSVEFTGCHHADDERGLRREGYEGHPVETFAPCSPWAEPDAYHWTIRDPQPLPEPIPMRGRQRLWRIPEVTA